MYYYIVNETNQIIAADENLLTLCGLTHINELNSHITLEKLTLKTISDNQLILTKDNQHHTFPIISTPLSSLIGKLTLITLDASKETTTSKEIDISGLIIKTDVQNDTITLIDDIENEVALDKEETLLYTKTEEPNLSEDSALYDLTDSIQSTGIPNIPLEITTPSSDETSLNEILQDDTFLLKDSNVQIPLSEDITTEHNIVIDITKVSEEIGVSEDDFSLFLNEYIDTALDLEKDLHSSNDKTRSSAIETLLHLSEVLHLDVVDDILKDINTSSDDSRTKSVTTFYDALSRITTTKPVKVIDDIDLFDLGLTEETTENIEMPIETIEIKPEPIIEIKTPTTPDNIQVEKKTAVTQNITASNDIDLSEVKAIHFDFQITAAADELSLPESLIEEFMVDFVEQAHKETDKMLTAYKNGDIKTVNKIGHLLKGVSSNLRITILSDTLYKIQFCEEANDLESLIKDYWGHFLFFEKQIKQLSN